MTRITAPYFTQLDQQGAVRSEASFQCTPMSWKGELEQGGGGNRRGRGFPRTRPPREAVPARPAPTPARAAMALPGIPYERRLLIMADPRDKALQDYRKKLLEHKEIDGRLKECECTSLRAASGLGPLRLGRGGGPDGARPPGPGDGQASGQGQGALSSRPAVGNGASAGRDVARSGPGDRKSIPSSEMGWKGAGGARGSGPGCCPARVQGGQGWRGPGPERERRGSGTCCSRRRRSGSCVFVEWKAGEGLEGEAAVTVTSVFRACSGTPPGTRVSLNS